METFTMETFTGQKFELKCMARQTTDVQTRDYENEKSLHHWSGIGVLSKIGSREKYPFDFNTNKSRLKLKLAIHLFYAALDFRGGSTDELQYVCSHAEAVDMLGDKIMHLLAQKKRERMPWIEMPYLEKQKILKPHAA